MKLYFAGESYNKILISLKKEKLGSFINIKEILNYWLNSNNKKIFLDSGAFSAFSLQKKIAIEDYIDFIKGYSNGIEVYAVLDVIGDWKKTQENQEYMESKGLSPLPTFHYGSPLRELERMCNKYDYIALGGLVPLALQRKKLQNWLDVCFNIIRLRCKVHGFGVNALWAWKRYPFYSVDATSWLASVKYGRDSFEKDKNKMLFEQATFHYLKRTEKACKDYTKQANMVTDLWKLRGIDWQS